MKVNENTFLEERQAQIYKIVNEYRRITVQELSKYFKISAVTIRNDLNALEQTGKIIRTHGGAIALEESISDIGSVPKSVKEEDIKRKLGKAASEKVKDGEVIFIDGGATCSSIYPYLTEKNDVTVITPNVEVAYWLTKTSSLTIYLIGGQVRRDTISTFPSELFSSLFDWNIAKAFISAYSFTPDDGIMETVPLEDKEKIELIKKAREIIALIESSKWGQISMTSFFKTDEIHTIITDAGVPKDMLTDVQQNYDTEIIQV
jgi:DeoR/GlpR family transcriptional regulator of sugar metabolism